MTNKINSSTKTEAKVKTHNSSADGKNPKATVMESLRVVFEAARSDRQVVQAKHAAALAAVETARRNSTELGQRLSSGDLTVSGLDLATAQAEIPRSEFIAESTAKAVAEARAVEAPAMSAYWAETIAERTDQNLIGSATDQATKAVEAAVTTVVEQIGAGNKVIHQAIRDGQAAGLRKGERVSIGAADGKAVLFIDGEMVRSVRVERALLDVLKSACTAAGFRLKCDEIVRLSE